MAALFAVTPSVSAQTQILDPREYHLGVAGKAEWQWFEGQTPFSNRLDIRFTSETNEREATLCLRQTDVKLDWGLQLNGRKLGSLFLMEEPLVHALAIPPGFLKHGENILSLLPPSQVDDIMIGKLTLDRRPLAETLSQTKLEVQISDPNTGQGLPCRITIVNERGDLVPLRAMPDQSLAVRPGIVYTANGMARLGLLPGKYSVYATRGFEYGLDRRTVTLRKGASKTIKMKLAREVPTRGWIACDTHVHTFTYARHGDATIEERMLTLAGEGIELPISTEHNVPIDFSGPAQRMNVRKFFTPVIGCEVTTDFGHFNAFPIDSGANAPNHRLHDWPKLMEAIRSTAGVQVVVLNHPRDAHAGFVPFAPANFDAVTGENLRGGEFTFDALEVINSGAMQSDWMLPFHDWFALLNHGNRITALASSDSHDVSRFIVGQGRSYVAGKDSDPGKIDIRQACESIRHGRVLVSLGLFTQMTVDGHFGIGDLATGLGKMIRVQVEVLAPSWIQADQVELFANGTKVREARLDRVAGKRNTGIKGNEWKVIWDIARPAHDFHLVAIASGPGVIAPYWPIARPYQPASRVWRPRVIGATNPIWIDGDGDRKFSSAYTADKQ